MGIHRAPIKFLTFVFLAPPIVLYSFQKVQNLISFSESGILVLMFLLQSVKMASHDDLIEGTCIVMLLMMLMVTMEMTMMMMVK